MPGGVVLLVSLERLNYNSVQPWISLSTRVTSQGSTVGAFHLHLHLKIDMCELDCFHLLLNLAGESKGFKHCVCE